MWQVAYTSVNDVHSEVVREGRLFPLLVFLVFAIGFDRACVWLYRFQCDKIN